jgi:hypothetical protein
MKLTHSRSRLGQANDLMFHLIFKMNSNSFVKYFILFYFPCCEIFSLVLICCYVKFYMLLCTLSVIESR